MGFWSQQKSLAFNDFERQLLLCRYARKIILVCNSTTGVS